MAPLAFAKRPSLRATRGQMRLGDTKGRKEGKKAIAGDDQSYSGLPDEPTNRRPRQPAKRQRGKKQKEREWENETALQG